MSKYIFIQEFNNNGVIEKVTHEFETDFQDTVLARFADFLRGCGFVISPYESLEFISEEACEEAGEAESQWDGDGWEQAAEEDTSVYKNLDHSAVEVWPFPVSRPQEGTEFPNWGGEKCAKCGMTRQQMGTNICYEPTGCPLGLNAKV